MKGFTLLEIIVVIALVGILSLFGSIKFNQFREDTILNLAAEEFASQIRSARNKSMVGEIKDGETASDFEDNGLPSYGVSANADSYSIFREYIANGSDVTTRENLETTILDSSLDISGDSEILFPRISGVSSGTFVIEKIGLTPKREISINSQGVITIKKI